MLTQGEAVTVLDVRRETEWEAGHIPGATHVPGNDIVQRAAEFADKEPLALVCGSGYRSSVAASLLSQRGFGRIYNVIGGMRAWQASEYQIEKPADERRAA